MDKVPNNTFVFPYAFYPQSPEVEPWVFRWTFSCSPSSPSHLQLLDAKTTCPCTVLYYIALYCTVLYCNILYCTVLYCTILHCTVLYCTVLYCTVLYCTVLYCTVLYCVPVCNKYFFGDRIQIRIYSTSPTLTEYKYEYIRYHKNDRIQIRIYSVLQKFLNIFRIKYIRTKIL